MCCCSESSPVSERALDRISARARDPDHLDRAVRPEDGREDVLVEAGDAGGQRADADAVERSVTWFRLASFEIEPEFTNSWFAEE